ncbi:MAG: adenine methyltransferase [Novosphingobium pentaromativorans]|uniref:Adenine methyltransferase n=1 Tax=Novosphingobium pentaromativorans TaxID=205844 RepID=A0A2W5NTW6_9SPHN|nr:MAG: adenine methyltransferase [Novosphingobium pentaromativorans]
MSSWETAGASDEWYTPKYIFDALDCRFDMDAAAPMRGPLHVPCDTWIYDYSLQKPWHGFVWMNPPFGGRNALEPWMGKFFDHGDGIALTPDRTSAPWFRKAWARADLVLFMPKVRFIRPDGTEGKSPSTGTALWAAGPRGREALLVAATNGLGIIAQPYDVGEAA